MNAVPAEAAALVARIEALLGQAKPLLASGGSDEVTFALRETERRYLPDTLKAYLDVPPARRDASVDAMLVAQLRLLERATAQRLATLAQRAENALAANGMFLSARFGPLEALPDTTPVVADPTSRAPASLVRRLLEQIDVAARSDDAALLERAAERFAAAFPAITTVRRGGVLGGGAVDLVALDVPRRDDLQRYVLTRTHRGNVEATVTRYLRGVKHTTSSYDIGEWAQALTADLGAYVERERGAREILTRLFQKSR